MRPQELKEKLGRELDFAKSRGMENNHASWLFQEGVLLSYKDAQDLLFLLDKLTD